MRKLLTGLTLSLLATPAFAAGDAFFSLHNTNFIVLLAFLLFIAVLIYYKVPGLMGGMLDKRADGIRSELDEARALREEAQSLLASYERKQREVQDQADRIVAHARVEAEEAAVQAKADVEQTLTRRLAAAEDQIASAQAAAVKDVRDRAITVAVAAAKDVVAKQMSTKDASKLIDDAIAEVGAKLH
ncbi:F0F1 ATP synthase subunit B [Puniceibacterium sp. IMCC21224]|uniref:F0F1 ATP synthase subunit B n=1 Tax=Puniceibacterium sp. IMCC21224 TaxID=1618204 RepID=UPI00064D8D45|nr:F0F1 ATP synthase subunit B [Puniceibacterium sp. IMCC21224]KMK68743.1 ATP synthase F0 subcomplex B subunit [Puniceibacterium sp. IMCC21224]